MRIISGYLKGKKINLPKDKKTRPLKDMVKESIFNIINHSNDISSKLKEAVVLDLFSGTGSFGLECVSRGAKKVIFNENYNSAIDILERNIKNLNCENKCQILIPEDCIVGTSFTSGGKSKDLDSVEDNDIILDIGPKTIKDIINIIEQSNTVLWNGPAGYFENDNFMLGTMSIAESISKNTVKKSLVSILGGGDTLAAVNKSKNKLSFTHLSTAGGAFLEYLEGKDLPGLSVLK